MPAVRQGASTRQNLRAARSPEPIVRVTPRSIRLRRADHTNEPTGGPTIRRPSPTHGRLLTGSSKNVSGMLHFCLAQDRFAALIRVGANRSRANDAILSAATKAEGDPSWPSPSGPGPWSTACRIGRRRLPSGVFATLDGRPVSSGRPPPSFWWRRPQLGAVPPYKARSASARHRPPRAALLRKQAVRRRWARDCRAA